MNKGLPKDVLKWRAKQKSGSIMKPETFAKIEKGAEKSDKYRNPEAVAGKAYWKSVKRKYKESKK